MRIGVPKEVKPGEYRIAMMPVGVEVRARIHCGQAAAGYVWFSEIWNFLYEKFVF